jgi:hypothetical protein
MNATVDTDSSQRAGRLYAKARPKRNNRLVYSSGCFEIMLPQGPTKADVPQICIRSTHEPFAFAELR